MALPIMLAIVLVSYILDLALMRMLLTYWLGVAVNLINFRLIVMGAHRFAAEKVAGQKPAAGKGFLIRQLLATAVLVLGALLGIPAMFSGLVGLSMTKFAIQLDGFLNFKAKL
jgi:hypothetical protein